MVKRIIFIASALSFGVCGHSQVTIIDKHHEMVNEIQNEFQAFINEIKAYSFQEGIGPTTLSAKDMDNSEINRGMTHLNVPDRYPIENTPEISSPYGFRKDPFTKMRAFHHGIDIAVPTNTDVLSTASGTVFKTAYNRVGGNYIVIEHNNKHKTYYGHLSSILVKKGELVKKGQLIGKSGNTGRST
ncbi:hypothetical protein LCGC14_3101190, partial [marine sediment metagenome]